MPEGASRKGIPNRNTGIIKDMIMAALDGVGGHEYLMRQAEENPAAFMSLIGKILPKQVHVETDRPTIDITPQERAERARAFIAQVFAAPERIAEISPQTPPETRPLGRAPSREE
jgi:hypothetical protein